MATGPAHLSYPSKLFVEVTTRCNLSCGMCVKQSPGNGIVDGDMSNEIFSRLVPAFSRLEALILNGIGEPLLHRSLENFIGTAKKHMPDYGRVGFQTNGHLVDKKRALSIVQSGVDSVCISADAVSPEVFIKLREGGNQEMVECALEYFREADGMLGRGLSIGVEFVLVRENIAELPRFIQWAAKQGVNSVIVTHMLPYQKNSVNSSAFDTNTDTALGIFRKWKAIASSNGVDLGRYFEVFMKYQKSEDDERIIEYVRELTLDAVDQGILLNMERLLKRDDAMLSCVEDSFRRAQEISQDSEIDLWLPGIAPTSVRRCEFIEGGGAFISWNGFVHPCYFLWHGYRCHIGGLEKHVRPTSFANLHDEDILSIWNSASFRSFREGVLKYDFPFCYDCNVALCDYVQLEEFTQDCHISSVPCAACLWCTGLFRCLQ